jgi:hypothetical protein
METKGGRCRHRPGRVEMAQKAAWQAQADAVTLFQQAKAYSNAGVRRRSR